MDDDPRPGTGPAVDLHRASDLCRTFARIGEALVTQLADARRIEADPVVLDGDAPAPDAVGDELDAGAGSPASGARRC